MPVGPRNPLSKPPQPCADPSALAPDKQAPDEAAGAIGDGEPGVVSQAMCGLRAGLIALCNMWEGEPSDGEEPGKL